MWDLLRPGIDPTPPVLTGRFLTPGLPGKFLLEHISVWWICQSAVYQWKHLVSSISFWKIRKVGRRKAAFLKHGGHCSRWSLRWCQYSSEPVRWIGKKMDVGRFILGTYLLDANFMHFQPELTYGFSKLVIKMFLSSQLNEAFKGRVFEKNLSEKNKMAS